MDNQLSFQIEIPSDEDGFILLQCPLCGELFKLTVTDIKADDVLEIWCPFCGLVSDNYLTDEVVDLAMRRIKNNVNDLLHNELKKIERKFNRGMISLKVTSRPRHEFESPLIPIVDTLVNFDFKCCGRESKVSPILKATSVFCPFCGVNCEHE